EQHLMPQLLELTQLVDQHSVAEMEIGSSRIKAGFHPQRGAALELRPQLGLHQDFVRPALDQRQLLVNRPHALFPSIELMNIKGERLKTIQHWRSRSNLRRRCRRRAVAQKESGA